MLFKIKELYQFPPNNRAEKETRFGQAVKIRQEADEAADALKESDERVIEETWDVIHAAEGLLRKFPDWKVRLGRARVMMKNARRGDYANEKKEA